MYGFAKFVVEDGKLKVYTQWTLEPNADWTKGEDLVFTSPEDKDKIIATLENSYIEKADVNEDGSITLWLKSKI